MNEQVYKSVLEFTKKELLKSKIIPPKLSKDELTASLIKSMATQLNSESEQEEEKEEKAPPAPAEQPKQAPPPKQEEAEKQAAHVITVGKKPLQPKEEKKEAVAFLSKAQVEAKLSRLDKAIDDSSHHLMRGMLKATREKVIRENVPIIITTNVQKSATPSNYKYSMGDMHMMVNILEEKGYDKDTIERALLWMSSQKKE